MNETSNAVSNENSEEIPSGGKFVDTMTDADLFREKEGLEARIFSDCTTPEGVQQMLWNLFQLRKVAGRLSDDGMAEWAQFSAILLRRVTTLDVDVKLQNRYAAVTGMLLVRVQENWDKSN